MIVVEVEVIRSIVLDALRTVTAERDRIAAAALVQAPAPAANDIEPHFTTDEAGKQLRLSAATVAGRCRDGSIRAKLVGRKWLVPKSALEELKSDRRPPRKTPEPPPEGTSEAADRILRRVHQRS